MQSVKSDVGLGKYFGTATIGVNYYCFGSKKDKTHADWAPKFDKNKSEIEALKNRVKIVENKLADTDRDGVADYLDLEPNTPEGSIVNTHGQKVVDSDGDGIEDTQDFCPTVKGTSEFKGCPQAITGSANNEQGKPVEGQLKYDIQKFTTDINFETKSTSIKPASKKQLDGLAKILSTNTNLIIQLNGHCDNIGEDILNNKLSLDRANSVKAYLVSKGVNAANIITKGFGTLKPKQSNETEKGRSANRRVDFEVKSK
jgi:OOP family OmpA-OmpF porin